MLIGHRAKITKSLYFGSVADKEDSQLSEKNIAKARRVGGKTGFINPTGRIILFAAFHKDVCLIC